ncbi:hypothetical protein E1281_33920 [Actinomadura sp. KC345]|uniref:hypothetical protein n=1 Tax=Actinomadura sp. KC345 TaxID=2530371 RepID=UPI001048D75F|nr:hypothetical protein [Actinomadura sp. KC345]TDC44461.1 hypothetical protein E1281_33920 [Actinomadura sp. KC345]
MSEDHRVTGPAMLAATNMLKPPPAVIGSVNKEMTLPRTIKLTTLIAVLIGAALGFLIAFIVVGPGLNALMYGPTLGGAAGWATVNFSPLQGESLAKWMGLQFNENRSRKLLVDDRQVRLYIGIAPLRRTAAGTVRMLPGGVSVDAIRWDSRGYPHQEIPGANRLPGRPRAGRGLTASSQLSSGRKGPLRKGHGR